MEKEKLNEALQQELRKTDFMLRLNEKLEEYRRKRDEAKAICDKQEKFDTSFQAEVEDEIFLDAETQYRAIKDLYDYVTEELKPELKQTAVDWLVEQLTSTTWKYVHFEERMEIFRKAKQMEEGQMQNIIDAYVTGRLKDKNIKYGIEYYNKLDDYIEEGKDYYNKTYKQ